MVILKMFKNIFNKKAWFFCIWIIFAYLIFILFYKLWYQSLWIDEWFSNYISKWIALNWFYKSNYFLFEWLQAICFKIWWFTDFWSRFPSVIIQICSIVLMFLFPYKLTKNKYIWIICALIFWFSQFEIAWARDARFYSLVQLIFISWLTTITYWIRDKKTIYLNLSIILSWIWIIFHPFLYMLWAITWIMFLYQYKKIWTFKDLFTKKYLFTWILVIFWLICLIWFWTIWHVFEKNEIGDKTWSMRKTYLILYNWHILWELWIIYVLWLLWMVQTIIKKKYDETILFFVPYILFMFSLVIVWKLLHFRYELLFFPICIISAVMFSYYLFQNINNQIRKYAILWTIIILSLITTKYQFFPKATYEFDFTAPQPDFKAAYNFLEDWQNIISWFPVLCDWYYSDRWNCIKALRVDMVWDWDVINLTSSDVEKHYTQIPYIDNLNELEKWTYYFVLDDLSLKSKSLNFTIYNQLSAHWEIVFEKWSWYNHIEVLKVTL